MPSLAIILLFLLSAGPNKLPVFTEQLLDSNISIGYGIALGDVDGDGRPDVLLADKKQFVWYRNGDWKKFLLIENLTEHDNVCIAARDINGDGKVEIAVGAQWNPSQTSDSTQSGSVHYLVRPADPTGLWKAIPLPHEPTVHRMKWFKSTSGKFYLLMLPLHGRGNVSGTGNGVTILAYEFPKNADTNWLLFPLNSNMHLTHNFYLQESFNNTSSGIYVAGKEGVMFIREWFDNSIKLADTTSFSSNPAGELSVGNPTSNDKFFATVGPMHGDKIAITPQSRSARTIIDDNVKEGHAIAIADFSGNNTVQVVAGWRSPNKDSLVGIKIYTPKDKFANEWESAWVDRNGIACEDIQVMDLNNDGKPDIIASGRATHNLKIYWNKTK